MNKPTSIITIFSEFLFRYPLHFGFLFFIILVEGAIAGLSVIAVVPLGDFLIDSSLQSTSHVTDVFLNITKHIGISPNFWLLGFFFVGLNTLKGIMDIFIRYTVLRIKYAIVRGLISETLHAFFKARWEFFNGTDQGRLLNTFNKELNTIGDTLGAIATLLAQTIQFIIYLSVPFWLNSSFTLQALLLTLLFGGPFLFLQRFSYYLGTRNTATANAAMGVLSEILAAARLILGFGRQKLARESYLKAFDSHIQVTLKSQTLMFVTPSMFRPIGMGAAIIAMGIALRQGSQISELAAVLWSLLACFPILAQLVQGNLSIKNFLPSYEQLVSLRKQAILVEEKAGGKSFYSLTNGIQVENVDFTYPRRDQTIQNINLEVQKGKMTAFVGESGSGKSTITDLILGLQIPEKGEVILDKLPLSKWKQNSFREQIGYVPQEPFLFHTTIKNNLLWSHEHASDTEIWEACQLANAETFIRELPEGINTVVGDRGTRLSGGQRQRIALARALLRKPELLILDEATSSLDTESEQLIQQSIEQLAGNLTILVIAHRLSTIVKADMIYVLKEGKIIEKGSYTELFKKNGLFAYMVRSQSYQNEK
jgi:ABC-type multidrug transport system fused ATPase/permease subunit